jgi:hypothetical protein
MPDPLANVPNVTRKTMMAEYGRTTAIIVTCSRHYAVQKKVMMTDPRLLSYYRYVVCAFPDL